MAQAFSVARFHDVPAKELQKVFERLAAPASADLHESIVALIRNRALRLIRAGSSTELRDEAGVLNRHLFSKEGNAFRAQAPEVHARLRAIADMLTEGSQRSDNAFVPAVMGSHRRYARPLLEKVAHAGGQGIPRRRLLEELELTESHLSHILADFEEADLIVRIRRSGGKEVHVILGAAGRDLVDEQILPQWFLKAMDFVKQTATTRRAPKAATVATALEKAAIPSGMMVTHLQAALDAIATRVTEDTAAGARTAAINR